MQLRYSSTFFKLASASDAAQKLSKIEKEKTQKAKHKTSFSLTRTQGNLDQSECRLHLTTTNEQLSTVGKFGGHCPETMDPVNSLTQGPILYTANSALKTEGDGICTQTRDDNEVTEFKKHARVISFGIIKKESDSLEKRMSKMGFIGPVLNLCQIQMKKCQEEPISSQSDLESLKNEENKKSIPGFIEEELQNDAENTCLVCFDKKADTVFMNCGHGGVCYECSLGILKKTGECHLCRLVFFSFEFLLFFNK